MFFHTKYEKHFILWLILLGTPLGGGGIDIYTPSLPILTTYFHTSHSLIKLTITTYLIGYGVGNFLMGALCDSFGRRKTLLGGLGAFVIFALLAACAPNVSFLLVARFLQGIAATATSVVPKAIGSDYYLDPHTARKNNIYRSIAWSLGPVISPFIGAYLQHYIAWQASFIFLAIYAGILFAITYLFIHETAKHLSPFNGKAIYSNYQLIFSNRTFLAYALAYMFGYAMIVTYGMLGPFFVQKTLGYSVVTYGHIALLMGLGCVVGTLINLTVIKRYDTHQVIFMGTLLAFISSIIFVALSIFIGKSLSVFVIFVFLELLLICLIYPNFILEYIRLFPKLAGSVNGAGAGLLAIGCAIITAIVSYMTADTTLPLALAYFVMTLLIGVSYFIRSALLSKTGLD